MNKWARPLESLDMPGLGTATLLEAVGTTENLKGEKMLDKMAARCTALSVDSAKEIYRRCLRVGGCRRRQDLFDLRHPQPRPVAARHELWHAPHHGRDWQIRGYHRQ